MKGKQLLSILILSIFIATTAVPLTAGVGTVVNSSDTVFNFWLNSGGISSEGGSAEYAVLNGPIGYTAGFLLTQTTKQSGYVILNNSVTANYGVYTLQAVMINASNPPADEIALVLGPSSPVNFKGGAGSGSVSSNGGTMVGVEFYSGSNKYPGPAIFVYTSQGLVLWQQISAVPTPWEAFSLEVGITYNEIWVAYYIGNQLVTNVTAQVSPTFSTSEVEVHASTGAAYAGFLLLQTGYFGNSLIATIQNEISMGLDYLLNMGEAINGYGYVPEYASPSVSFLVTYTNGSTAYFVPGAPANSPSVYGTPVYGTPKHTGWLIVTLIPESFAPGISVSLVSETATKVSVSYDAYTYGNETIDPTTGYIYYYKLNIFEANEVVNYGNPSSGIWSVQVIVNINYTASSVQTVHPYLASGFVLNQVNGTAWEYTQPGQYFYPASPLLNVPLNAFPYTLPPYPDQYFHSFRITIRHVQEMMDMLTEESPLLSPFHNSFNSTVYYIQSAVGVWGKDGNQPASYYATLFGYPLQPNMGINFYDAINNNWPKYKNDTFNLLFPNAYPYKSGLVVINENGGGQIWAELLNSSIVGMNQTYSMGFGGGYYDPLAYEEEGLYYTNVGQWSNALSAWNDIYNFYQRNHGLYYTFAIFANGNFYSIYSEGSNDTLRYADAVALGSTLAGNGYISWSQVIPILNTLIQTQWQGSGYAKINGQESNVIVPTDIGGFETGFTNDPVFSTSRPTVVSAAEQAWGQYGGTLSGGLPEEVEWPGVIIANAETTIVSVQALAMFLYYYYRIPLSMSLSPYNAYLIP